jgi:hypothetical protein
MVTATEPRTDVPIAPAEERLEALQVERAEQVARMERAAVAEQQALQYDSLHGTNSFMRGKDGYKARLTHESASQRVTDIDALTAKIAVEVQEARRAEANRQFVSAVAGFSKVRRAEDDAWRAFADGFVSLVRLWPPLVAACRASDVARAEVDALQGEASDTEAAARWQALRQPTFSPRPAHMDTLIELLAAAAIDMGWTNTIDIRGRGLRDLVEDLTGCLEPMPTPPGLDRLDDSGALGDRVLHAGRRLERARAEGIPVTPVWTPDTVGAQERMAQARAKVNDCISRIDGDAGQRVRRAVFDQCRVACQRCSQGCRPARSGSCSRDPGQSEHAG